MGVPIINIHESKSDYLAVKEINTISKVISLGGVSREGCKIIVQI